MLVQHNMASLNTNRQLGITDKLLSKSTEKLSSGYRVNRAANDTNVSADRNAIALELQALSVVSQQRSKLGALQNRLDHTIANGDNMAENLQSSESKIRDVDMAKEMVTYSAKSILQQAGQSMLAQANQATQGVLSLLR